MKISFIGAGKMGLPICRRLMAAGHDVTILVRRKEQTSSFEAEGFGTRNSVSDLIRDAEIIFTCVPDDRALQEVLASGVFNTSARTLIDMSTVSPAVSAAIAAQLPEGLAFLRSPVSGSTVMAQAGTLTALTSGPKAAFEAMAPILACFTKVAFHLGEAEEARFLKLAINSMVAATSALLGEALAFGLKGGLTHEAMLQVITQSAVASPLIGYKKDMIVSGNYAPAATLNMLAKDLDLFLASARENGTAAPVNTLIRGLYQVAADKGLGEKDFFVLVQEAERASRVRIAE